MSATEPENARHTEAEALLEGWPAPARSALEWEDAANAVMARVNDTVIGSTPDELLAAPALIAEPDEESSAALATDEPGLADIARAAVQADSGEKAVARDGLLAAERGRLEPEASRPRPPPPRVGNVAELQGRLASPSKAHAPVTAAEAHSELPAGQSKSGPGFGAGLFGGAVLAFAAAAALFVALRNHDGARVLSAPSAEASVTAPVVATGERDTKSPQQTLALADLPAAPEPAPNAAAAAPGRAAQSAAKDTLAFRVKSAPKGKVVLERREDDVQAGVDTPAAEPVAKSAAASETAPTEGAPSGPSVGAVQAALGSVMGSARSCLAGQDTGSRAQVAFGSDGRVKTVSVSGPAAGTPAEDCLRAALKAARVPPFSDPSFSAGLTIRPP